MEQLTDRIANVPLQTVLVLLAGLTAARVALCRAKVAWGRSLSDLFESVLLALVLVFLLLRPFVVQSFFIPSGSMRPTLREGDRILVNKWVYRFRKPQRSEVVVFRAPRDAAPDEKDFIKRLIGVPGDTIEVREGYVAVRDGPRQTIYTHSEVRSVLGAGGGMDLFRGGNGGPPAPLRLTTDAIWLGGRKVTREDFARAAGKPGGAVRIAPGKVLCNGVMLCESYVAEDPKYRWGPKVVPRGHLFVMGDNRNESHDSHIWGMLPEERVIGRADVVFWPPGHVKWIHEPRR